MPRTRSLASLLLVLVTGGCITGTAPVPVVASAVPAEAPAAAVQAIDGAALLHHITVLASDDFEGRSAGTHGEAMTVEYLTRQFKALGLAPGNPDGTYVQDVPLTSHQSHPAAQVHLADGSRMVLHAPEALVAWSYERRARVEVHQSDLVFVGYGVTAPEYRWDDLKGIDLKGKTLVMLINDPQVPDPDHPDRLDPGLFKGEAMTYYGRWTYKFEQAAAQGAAAALIIHETKPAAYPYEVVVNSWSRDNFDIRRGGANPEFPPVAGWIPVAQARGLFKATGLDFDQLKQAALRRDFRPVVLNATIDLQVDNSWHDLASQNVVARIEGSDPALRNDTLVYSAHWDHFGWDPSLPGDKHAQVYHGALDNASGVAALLELAKAFKALPQPPRRSILFLATTAEERGLLGAQYYAQHPLYPLERTVADINMDGMNPAGRTRDVEVVGYGNSDLDARLTEAAGRQGRTVRPDTNTPAGSFYRADHFEFAKAGVPALYLKTGSDFIGQPAGFAAARRAHYTEHDYHKVTDVVRPDWDLSGAVEDTRLLLQVGYGLAQDGTWPQWKEGAEFKARREAMLAASRR